MSFEDDLRGALRREPAPEGFAERVIAMAGSAQPFKVVRMPVWRRPLAWAIAAGLLFAAAVPSGVMEYRRRQDEKALLAKRELMLALSVARIKLQQTREMIQKRQRNAL